MEKDLIIKLNNFTDIINETKWFSNIGKDFNKKEKDIVLSYTHIFNKTLKIHKIENWEKAIKLLNSNSWNKNYWNKEEHERKQLYNLLKTNYSETNLSKYLGKFTNDISNIIGKSNFKNLKIDEKKYDYYSRVAIGSAASCCNQAALAIISNRDDHVFIKKFKLFEFGFWPLIISNNVFNIF